MPTLEELRDKHRQEARLANTYKMFSAAEFGLVSLYMPRPLWETYYWLASPNSEHISNAMHKLGLLKTNAKFLRDGESIDSLRVQNVFDEDNLEKGQLLVMADVAWLLLNHDPSFVDVQSVFQLPVYLLFRLNPFKGIIAEPTHEWWMANAALAGGLTIKQMVMEDYENAYGVHERTRLNLVSYVLTGKRW
jgi:hypothetical protein